MSHIRKWLIENQSKMEKDLAFYGMTCVQNVINGPIKIIDPVDVIIKLEKIIDYKDELTLTKIENVKMKKFIISIMDAENTDHLDVMGVDFQLQCEEFLNEEIKIDKDKVLKKNKIYNKNHINYHI